MSRSDDTLQEALEQHLESLKATGKADDWLRDVVQWLIQEILDLEFSQFLGADPYPVGHRTHFVKRRFSRAGARGWRTHTDISGP
jgi:transposase-like protein